MNNIIYYASAGGGRVSKDVITEIYGSCDAFLIHIYSKIESIINSGQVTVYTSNGL